MSRYFLSFLVVLTCCFACETEKPVTPPTQAELILGNWNLKTATRNGKETKSMEGTYFNFETGSALRTNFFGYDKASKYAIKEGVINLLGDQKVDFRVDNLDSTYLNISTRLRGMTFKMALEKGQPAETPIQ